MPLLRPRDHIAFHIFMVRLLWPMRADHDIRFDIRRRIVAINLLRFTFLCIDNEDL